jgi:hypothetical protein
MSGGSATLEVVGSRRTLREAGYLLRPVRVLDDVHKAGPLEAGHEALEDIRVDVSERGFRLGGAAFLAGAQAKYRLTGNGPGRWLR